MVVFKQILKSRVMGLFTLFLLGGCQVSTNEPLGIGLNAWPGYEFLYLAREKGFYRDEGVDVRLVEFNSLSDARRAFERGQIDVMGTTLVEVLLVGEHSKRAIEVVRVVDFSNGADVILAQPHIKTAKDLRGARIGVELASVCVYVLARGLERYGLTLEDVKMVSMDQMSMEEAFRKGELQAMVTYPPTSIKVLRDLKARTLFSSSEVPGEIVDVIAVDTEIGRRRAKDVTKLMRAYQRAVEYTQQNPSDAYGIMARREGVSPEEFRDALTNGISVVGEGEQIAFLGVNGRLEKAVTFTDKILRLSGQITEPAGLSSVYTSKFVEGRTGK